MNLSEVLETLDRLGRSNGQREAIEAALSTQLETTGGNEFFNFFGGNAEQGWFEKIDYREQLQGDKKFLVVYPRDGVRIAQDLEELRRALGQPSLRVNPHVAPSGSTAYVHELPSGPSVTLSFESESKILRLVSLQWQ